MKINPIKSYYKSEVIKMETIKEMIVYLEENQIRIDNEINDNKKAKEIFQDIENLKNKLEDISLT